MSIKTTHTAELHAWLSPHHRIEGLFDSKPEAVLSCLSYSTSGPDADSFMKREGYTYIGKARVAVEVGNRDKVISSKVDSLRAQQKEVVAKAQAESTRIEVQIQKLLAISFDGAAA